MSNMGSRQVGTGTVVVVIIVVIILVAAIYYALMRPRQGVFEPPLKGKGQGAGVPTGQAGTQMPAPAGGGQ